jgi:hypothetical protein
MFADCRRNEKAALKRWRRRDAGRSLCAANDAENALLHLPRSSTSATANVKTAETCAPWMRVHKAMMGTAQPTVLIAPGYRCRAGRGLPTAPPHDCRAKGVLVLIPQPP